MLTGTTVTGFIYCLELSRLDLGSWAVTNDRLLKRHFVVPEYNLSWNLETYSAVLVIFCSYSALLDSHALYSGFTTSLCDLSTISCAIPDHFTDTYQYHLETVIMFVHLHLVSA